MYGLIDIKKRKFLAKYSLSGNVLCQAVVNASCVCVWLVIYRHMQLLSLSDVPAHMALRRHISLSVGRPPGPDWLETTPWWTPSSKDRPDLTGLQQFTSGTLEVWHVVTATQRPPPATRHWWWRRLCWSVC